MPRKRLVFTLLYDRGHFVLSRNFRLQRVGGLDWLTEQYNFRRISQHIDELVLLDVSRGDRNMKEFIGALRSLSTMCFVPIAAGGGVRSLRDARELLRSGADKIVVNSTLFDDVRFINDLVREFGQQSVVGSIDAKQSTDVMHSFYIHNGSTKVNVCPTLALAKLAEGLVGEIYLNSMDRDGTGQGYDMSLLNILPEKFPVPVIFAGGVGSWHHLAIGLKDPRIDAVATANLFNFLGDGLQRARSSLLEDGASLAYWLPYDDLNMNLIRPSE